jgi:predicted kinase
MIRLKAMFEFLINFVSEIVLFAKYTILPYVISIVIGLCIHLKPGSRHKGPSILQRKNMSSSRSSKLSEAGDESLSSPSWISLGLEQPLVIVMVGLPARGKSYIVKMIKRYLNWTGYECEVFNVGSYRRKVGLASADANFFAGDNKDGQKVRDELAMAVQDGMYTWLREECSGKRRVAIFDATNTTKNRRLALLQKARKENTMLLFVESICDDKKVLEQNYTMKLQNDDYKGMDPEKARKDFLARVEAYEKVYEVRQ